MNPMFQKVLETPGLATLLASVILSRTIPNICRGFTDNPDLPKHISVYRLIKGVHSVETEEVPAAFKRLFGRAKRQDNNAAMYAELGLTSEQATEWASLLPEDEYTLMKNGVQDVIRIFRETKTDMNAWDELPAIAQHSLLVGCENALPAAITRYQGWNSERGQTLLENAIEAQIVVSELIEEHLAEYAEEIQASGAKLPVRRAA